MDFMHAVILGITEGLTELLPISSTGHMILVSKFIGLEQSDFLRTFQIAIQLGSIFAVIVVFYQRLIHDPKLWLKLFVGFLPTSIVGLTLYPFIKSFFHPAVVAYMLIFGGIVFLWIEYFYKSQDKLDHIHAVSYKQAFWIGLFQSLAIIPGTSRSGASIVGGLLLGLSRKCAAEFSFLLAIPTMFAATGYDLYKNFGTLNTEHFELLLIGGGVAFITTLSVIKVFLRFISTFGYGVFGIYRILVGSICLLVVF